MEGPARRVLGLVLLALAAACSDPPGERVAAAPPPAAPSPAPSPPPREPAAPAPAPEPSALSITRAEAIEPSAATVPLKVGEEAVVDPAARFRIELRGPVRARVVLLDERDAHVTGTATREVGTTSTVLELEPEPALRPGSKYLLRIEGVDGGAIPTDAGAALAPVSVPIVAAGQPPPPEPVKKPARKRRR
ncbi:MAG TPA: hypothetical protein VD838_01075 [Anaeromyxobacteraceae bacterium]|nr:hypothetical protein [Anaeromyxobacteraceae bacterium]